MESNQASGNSEPGSVSTLARWLAALPRGAVLLSSLWLIAEQIYFARLRLPEPYPLRWLETYLFRSTYEASQGRALFGEPSLEYIAPIYQPLSFLLGGVGFRLFGPSFTLLRTASCLAFAGCVVLIFVWLRRTGQERTTSLGVASLALLVPRVLNDWLTTANLDAPFFLFVLLGLALVRFGRESRRAVVLSAFAMFIGFAIKQQTLPFAAAAGLVLLVESRRRFLEFALPLGVVVATWILAWHLGSDGWSTKISLMLPLQSATSPEFNLGDWVFGRLPLAAVAFGLGVGGVLLLGPRTLRSFWLCLGTAALLMTWMSGRKAGGTVNNLVPYLLLSFLVLGEAWSAMRLRGWHAERWITPLLLIAVSGLLAVEAREVHGQNTRLRNAHAAAPGPSAYRQIELFEQRLTETLHLYPGPVFVGGRTKSVLDAGRAVENFHQTALYEGTVRTEFYDLEAILGEAIRSRRFDAMIVWRREQETELRDLLLSRYAPVGLLGRDPLIGLDVEVWEPR